MAVALYTNSRHFSSTVVTAELQARHSGLTVQRAHNWPLLLAQLPLPHLLLYFLFMARPKQGNQQEPPKPHLQTWGPLLDIPIIQGNGSIFHKFHCPLYSGVSQATLHSKGWEYG